MCVQVVLSTVDRKRGGELTPEGIAAVSGLRASLRDDGRLQLDLQKGCSCFFVAGDIVSGDWKLRPEVIEPLVKAAQFAGTQTRKFRFSATWYGDPAPQVEDLGLEEFVARISNARISGRYLYVVQAR